ncbi:allene oxide cyclase barrel-like domain-containing protein [Nonomuraea aurantiaca]|uniref:allene oxide cyclase barrel-like domain-containing protein n=1 Tax=Nonomuraea aurantiaca TaxID=2878562 RepID=UPI001CDA13CA|nr:hypothetical protein [Nonomuraea aurantiaca]MCA2220215.1 hypothetical protein [Nonomuraea aurantiaca]
MRKINIRYLGAAAALAATPLASVLSDSVQDAHQRTEIIQLVAKQTQSQSLDLGEKGLGLGDERIIAEDLYQDGKKIGDHSVVCVYVHLDPGQLQCVGTFALPRGQIAGQALLHLPPAPAIDIPITGGAGAYSTAHGYVHTVPAGETERRLTFHITH